MKPKKTKEVIEQHLGKPIDEVFAWIDLGAPLRVCLNCSGNFALANCDPNTGSGLSDLSGWYSMHGSTVAFALPPTWDFVLEALLEA